MLPQPVQASQNNLTAEMPAALPVTTDLPEGASMDWWASVQADLALSSQPTVDFSLTLSPLSITPLWIGECNHLGAQFGYSVSSAGDVNNDGYDDVVIGALYYDKGQVDEGAAFVYHGSASGLKTTPAWTGESNQESAGFGWPVRSAGDVNNDGFADVVIGSVFYDNGQIDEGRVFVYHGSGSGLGLTPAWTAESDQENGEMGYAASAGDVNGDGYSDLIVSAVFYDHPEIDEGRVYTYYGSNTGLAPTPAWTVESNQTGAYFGWSVSGAGDVNNDGYADVIIGAVYYDHPEVDEGAAFAYTGSASGLEQTPSWIGESNQSGAWFGFSVSGAGDVNGDGYDDVITGANNYDNGQRNEGRAYLYYGSVTGHQVFLPKISR